MVSRTDRRTACGVEPLEHRHMMDSTFGQAVATFVQAPEGNVFQHGPIIANATQLTHNPRHAPPPPVVEHFLEAIADAQ